MDNISDSSAFRIAILGVMLFTDWILRYGRILKPEYFPSRDEQEIVEWVNWYYGEYAVLPSDADIDNALADNPLLDATYAVVEEDLRYAVDMALEFAKIQAMKLAILDCVEHIKRGQLENIRDRVEEALAVGTDRLLLGYDLVADATDWMYDEVHGRRYPTGWQDIDKMLDGGTVAGEYGLLMAPTGRGKTTGLINIGYAMAGLMSAANVLHVTLEMPAQKILKRYAVRITGDRMPRGDDYTRYRGELERSAKANLRAKLRVVRLEGCTLDMLRRLLDNLAVEDFETEALIVDYADLMIPPRKRSDFRFELGDVARGLRGIGEEYEIPVWSATQAGRQALYKEYVTLADIAEAIDKASVADLVLAICQTREEESAGHGRLFAAKVRDAKSNFVIPVKIDFERQAIVQRGKLEI